MNGAGWLNTAVLKYWFNRSTTAPFFAALEPLLFGRCVPFVGAPAPFNWPKALDVLTALVSAKGSPLAKTAIPFACQPPRKESTARFIPRPNRLPLPNGISYVPLRTSRCWTSKTDRLRSARRLNQSCVYTAGPFRPVPDEETSSISLDHVYAPRNDTPCRKR